MGDPQGASRSTEGMTLQWSPQSIHDLIALRAHIAEDDPVAAKDVALHILYCVEHLLAENPQLGHPGRVYGTRELVIPKTPFVVPYRVRDNALEILRVYHHASRWPERLQPLPRDKIPLPPLNQATDTGHPPKPQNP